MPEPKFQTAQRRLAVLPVSNCFTEAHVRRILPPEHHIVATRIDDASGLMDYVIEGPTLSEARASEPPVVSMQLTMHEMPGRKIRLDAKWDGPTACAGQGWTVGEWDSVDAYREEMEALDAR